MFTAATFAWTFEAIFNVRSLWHILPDSSTIEFPKVPCFGPMKFLTNAGINVNERSNNEYSFKKSGRNSWKKNKEKSVNLRCGAQ